MQDRDKEAIEQDIWAAVYEILDGRGMPNTTISGIDAGCAAQAAQEAVVKTLQGLGW